MNKFHSFSGRKIDPPPISGNMRVRELVDVRVAAVDAVPDEIGAEVEDEPVSELGDRRKLEHLRVDGGP